MNLPASFRRNRRRPTRRRDAPSRWRWRSKTRSTFAVSTCVSPVDPLSRKIYSAPPGKPSRRRRRAGGSTTTAPRSEALRRRLSPDSATTPSRGFAPPNPSPRRWARPPPPPRRGRWSSPHSSASGGPRIKSSPPRWKKRLRSWQKASAIARRRAPEPDRDRDRTPRDQTKITSTRDPPSPSPTRLFLSTSEGTSVFRLNAHTDKTLRVCRFRTAS